MKIIDLLNKIANDEEVPEIILFNSYKYKFDKIDNVYRRLNGNSTLGAIVELDIYLNDEVEIIEEDKKIEKLNNIPINYADDRTPEEVYEYLRCTINNLANVINTSNENLFELIDKVNSLENKQ